jgi:hypothetical protein
MAIGVKKAGYPVAEEFPIFLVVFAIPAAVAMVPLVADPVAPGFRSEVAGLLAQSPSDPLDRSRR